ncbi:hypothetical protein [Microbacterium natoriense]
MSKKIRLLIAILLAGLALLATVAFAFFVSRSAPMSEFEALVKIPIVLTPDQMGSSDSTGVLEIREDEQAVLREFPVGSVEEEDGRLCLDWDGESVYTGDATWSVDENYMVSISSDSGDVVIGPYHPSFSDVVGYKFGIPLCGAEGDAMWYWAESVHRK